MLPRISLVTPSLNQGAFIGDTIDSVARQEYPNLEYLVIDGGSTDSTAAIVSRSAVVSEYVCEPDNGQAAALNKGFARATGDILCWLNADDMLEPGALHAVAAEYERGEFTFVYGDGWKLWHRWNLRRHVRVGPVRPEWLRIRDPILQPSTFWSRRVHERVGALDETLHYVFDWDFFVRVSQAVPMRYLRHNLSTYRIHPQHKTSSGGERRSAEIMEVIHRYAPAEWRDTFDAWWSRYDRVRGTRKVFRVFRAASLALREPQLLWRHGPARASLSALTLL